MSVCTASDLKSMCPRWYVPLLISRYSMRMSLNEVVKKVDPLCVGCNYREASE